MAPVHVLDNYYLGITLLISFGLQAILFAVSFSLQTDKLTDLGGSANFFILALFTLLAGNTYYARNIVASVFVMVWSFRLGGFLFFRVLKTGKDGRFDEMRKSFVKFGTFWLFSMLWAWVVHLPVTILNSPNVSDPLRGGGNVAFGSARDIAGIVLWAIGFTVEVLGDQQKYMFKARKPPRGAINEKGVWNWTRHPNYFGEIVIWWGIWILCLEPAVSRRVGGGARSALYGAVVGPIFITLLLMFASGVPTAEKPTAKRYYLMTYGKDPEPGDKWAEYKAYLNRTSILFPIPPSLYKPLPKWLKTTVLLDLPMYHFDEHKDGPAALDEQQKKSHETA